MQFITHRETAFSHCGPVCLRIWGPPPLWTFLKEILRHIFLAWLLLKVPHHLFYSSIVASFFICYFTLFAFGHLCLFVFVFVALSFSHVQHIGLQPLHEMCYINKIDLMIWFDLIWFIMAWAVLFVERVIGIIWLSLTLHTERTAGGLPQGCPLRAVSHLEKHWMKSEHLSHSQC